MSDHRPIDSDLDAVHHVAVSVKDVETAVDWYQSKFRCSVVYQDQTWAMLQFANLQLALVVPGQHPPHVGFATAAAGDFGELRTHRDGTRSIYVTDVDGNSIELLDPESIPTEPTA